MAQRQSTKRILSDQVQGEGSYVVLRAVPYGLITRRAKMDADDMGQMLEFNAEFLASVVVDWNWVDDAGEALPLPADDPTVLDRLVLPEFQFIAEAAGLNDAGQAKKVSKLM
jgi:hypothetical protein